MGFTAATLQTCAAIVSAPYEPRDGRMVPSLDDVALRDGAVDIDASVIYADLADSTSLVDNCYPAFAAHVTRVFLYTASQCIKRCAGTITSFDGDRVMGVFTGTSHVDRAAKAAFALSAAIQKIVFPALRYRWDLDATDWKFNYGVGLDTSLISVIRAGPPGDNDLVWLGSAANHAAALSARREWGYTTYATPRFVDGVVWYERNVDDSFVWEVGLNSGYRRSSSFLMNLDELS